MPAPRAGGPAVEAAWRAERTAVLATVARRVGDLGLAEDAVSEAFAAAALRWPVDGTPQRPGAWLTTTAWRKALDMRRRDHFPLAARPEPAEWATADPRLDRGPDEVSVRDDVLALILTCAHPALATEAQVALTLRHVASLSVREIASAYLVSEATMTKRLVRARAKIRDAGISFTPPGSTLNERLAAAHAVIYLVFNEGYLTTGTGPSIRPELCTEAIWLARQLHQAAPIDPETTGLLALLLLQHARASARRHPRSGELLVFAEQDRTRWDTAAITEARALLATTGRAPIGPYQVQAAIALLHTPVAGTPVNWSGIADLYTVLARLAPSPIVTVNRAVAIGHADGPHSGLAALAAALHDHRLDTYVPLHAAHADLLEQAGDVAAPKTWRHAAAVTLDPAQREQLLRRAIRAEWPDLPAELVPAEPAFPGCVERGGDLSDRG